MNITFLNTILNFSRQTKRAIQILVDAIIISLAFYLSLFFVNGSEALSAEPNVLLAIICIIIASVTCFVRLGLYRAVIRYLSFHAFRVIIVGSAVSTIFFLLSLHLVRISYEVSVLFIYFFILTTVIGGVRALIREIYASKIIENKLPVAIYGAGQTGLQLCEALFAGSNFHPVFYIDDLKKKQGTQLGKLRVFSLHQSEKLLKKLDVKVVLLAMPSLDIEGRKKVVARIEAACSNYLPEIKTAPSLKDVIEKGIFETEIKTIDVEELLDRKPVPPLPTLMASNIRGKTVLVSGAGGSIGSEICRCVLDQQPEKLILLESSEHALHEVNQEFECDKYQSKITPVLCNIRDKKSLKHVFSTWSVDTVYHAAAYKHVGLLEENTIEAVKNNVFGTKNLLDAAGDAKVAKFTFISTDKAVRPTSFMGSTKRLAEIICKVDKHLEMKVAIVRFGNVLGSSGSVIPIFANQIDAGGPVTVRDKDATRFFMTIKEAAQLVIQAGNMSEGGDIFVLDMGKPVNILELAQRMVRLRGLKSFILPEKKQQKSDIEIVITGMLQGEKIHEELLENGEPVKTIHPRIYKENKATDLRLDLDKLLYELKLSVDTHDDRHIRELMKTISSKT